jgi:Protein of unknown function (DUF2924)
MLKMERVGARSAPTEPSQQHGRATGPDLAGQLAAIPNLSYAELRAEWRRLYRASPPKKIGRDILELAVAWKLQERPLGGSTSGAASRLSSTAGETPSSACSDVKDFRRIATRA